MIQKDLLRKIPKMDEILNDDKLRFLMEEQGRKTVVDAVREVLDEIRSEIFALAPEETEAFQSKLTSAAAAIRAVLKVEEKGKPHLRPVINATGTILHTNLGRAPLARAAAENVARLLPGYSNLEYDVPKGKRGSRHDILQETMMEMTGAEDVMIVNNNASATLLVLSSMAAGKEVIVSRGELVEIGGSFRIPDIMEQGGAKLREVGTTNKTKISDYENAINENTGALMKVHTSNYKVMGFTQEATLEELVELGRKHDLPVIFDMGNGLMVDLSPYGLDEPNVPASLETGIDVILFSGDKLLGGPQAGMIAGKREYIEKMKKHPLARALRVDKMTFAAMEATLMLYRDEVLAKKEIPVLRMITEEKDSLTMRAEALAERIREANPALKVRLIDADDQIGGGSAPMFYLPGKALALSSDEISTAELEKRLRRSEPPVVGRIHEDELLLAIRTIREEEYEDVVRAVGAAKDSE